MEDFKDICADLADKYDLYVIVEQYFSDNRITKATFRIQGVGYDPTWASVSVPTSQACEPLVKRFIRAQIVATYAQYGGDELRTEANLLLKSVAKEARKNHMLRWIADRAESFLTEPV